MPPEIPMIIVRWESLLGRLLDCTGRFPKAVRFTFSTRIDNLALDALEWLVLARYARAGEKVEHLARVDSALDRLRALLRLSRERRYVDKNTHEALIIDLDEVGRMLGGWREEVAARVAAPRR